MPERTWAAHAEISAPPEAVWAVLIDLPGYADWNPFTTAARSTLQVGDPISLRVDMGYMRLTQVEYIAEVTPLQTLNWSAHNRIPWLLRADRVQTLRPHSGGTRYETTDTIGGLLLPLVELLFARSLTRGFAAMAEALKAEVERRG